jgi:isopenicillin-N epimerase
MEGLPSGRESEGEILGPAGCTKANQRGYSWQMSAASTLNQGRPIRVAAPAPLRPGLIREWALDPTIDFLNHGCFGARPRKVIEAQTRRRMDYEARPVEWLDRRRRDLINHAKGALSAFIGTTPANIGFVTNATEAVNAVMRSLTFAPGDELLTTNHVYNAVRMTMRHLAERAGATYIEAAVPMPLTSPDEVVAAIAGSLSLHTRLLVIDHLTSPTAVLFPVERIVALCRERNIDVLVDGAHAPGMIPLNVEVLNAAYYAGNLHKWMCAPSGAGFLWVRPDKQKGIHPPTISHFLDQGIAEEFQWQATRDITPWLCVEDSIAYMAELGWAHVMRHNHQMATWVQQALYELWEVDPATPLDGSMLGSMATVQLPREDQVKTQFGTTDVLQARLYNDYHIEAPVIDWGGRWWIRASCQVYNTAEQYERLGRAVLELIR